MRRGSAAACALLFWACKSVVTEETSGAATPTASMGSATVSSGSGACSQDLAIDPRNCGHCGHDCQGGLCVAANCQPFALASVYAALSLIADAEYLYWSGLGDPNPGGGDVVKLTKKGGTMKSIAALSKIAPM